MTTYEIEVRFSVVPVRLVDEFVDEFVDELMEAMLDEPNIIDPDLGVTLSTGVVEATMVVETDDQVTAMSVGFTALRSALHKIGGHTPGWEADLQQALATVRPPEFAA